DMNGRAGSVNSVEIDPQWHKATQNPALQQVSRSGITRLDARETLPLKRREFITLLAGAGGGVTLLRPRPRSIIIAAIKLVFPGGEREQRHFHRTSPSQVTGRRGPDRSACRAHILPPRLARPGRTRV